MKKNTVLLEKLRNSYHNSFIDGEIALTRIINQEDIGRLFALLRQLLFPECLGVDYSMGSRDVENQIEKLEEKLIYLIKIFMIKMNLSPCKTWLKGLWPAYRI